MPVQRRPDAGRIRPSRPSAKDRAIAFGVLMEVAERCDEMRQRVRSITDNALEPAETFRRQAAALKRVADWIRPEQEQNERIDLTPAR